MHSVGVFVNWNKNKKIRFNFVYFENKCIFRKTNNFALKYACLNQTNEQRIEKCTQWTYVMVVSDRPALNNPCNNKYNEGARTTHILHKNSLGSSIAIQLMNITLASNAIKKLKSNNNNVCVKSANVSMREKNILDALFDAQLYIHQVNYRI